MIGSKVERDAAWLRGFRAAQAVDLSRGLMGQFGAGYDAELYRKDFAKGWAKGRMAACLG